jgi:probable F420-dependent oxidoreductase
VTAGGPAPSLRIGARFPSAGTTFRPGGLAAAARTLEDAGFDSLWASDHLAMPRSTRSHYPYTEDGTIPWGEELGWNEALTALGIAAAVTSRIELGTAVLVAALRHPLVAARQAAAVAVEAGGRVTLGVGAGWLAEEFDAVGVPFERRGRHLDAWLDYVRQVWDGELAVRPADDPYPLPTAMTSRPIPPGPIGILIGGISDAALRRAVRSADGWLGIAPLADLDPQAVAVDVARLHAAAEGADRDPATLRVCLQVTGSEGGSERLRPHLSGLAAAGVDDVLIDAGWQHPEQPHEDLTLLRDH